jgi:acetyl/propionyl-CoA carboxylase alpha subunit
MEMKDSTGTVHEVDVDLDRIDVDARPGRLWLDGHLAHVAKVGDDWWVHLDGRIEVLTVVEQGAGGGGDDGGMTAPMPGKVLELLCAVGDVVEEGQALLVMEAMKMEHRIAANQAGTITDIHHDVGGQVAAGAVLIDIEPVEESN